MLKPLGLGLALALVKLAVGWARNASRPGLTRLIKGSAMNTCVWHCGVEGFCLSAKDATDFMVASSSVFTGTGIGSADSESMTVLPED